MSTAGLGRRGADRLPQIQLRKTYPTSGLQTELPSLLRWRCGNCEVILQVLGCFNFACDFGTQAWSRARTSSQALLTEREGQGAISICSISYWVGVCRPYLGTATFRSALSLERSVCKKRGRETLDIARDRKFALESWLFRAIGGRFLHAASTPETHLRHKQMRAGRRAPVPASCPL